jgi:hypothetical protein
MSAPQQPVAAAPVEGWAVKRSVVRVVVLLLVSLGFYLFYWFYKTREKITAELGTQDNVGLQTWGLLVPILNWFILYWLLRDIAEARRRIGLPEDMDPILATVIWLLVGPVGIGLSQNSLNQYWDTRSNGYATDAKMTAAEIAVAIVPLVLWGLFIVIAIVAAVAGSSS